MVVALVTQVLDLCVPLPVPPVGGARAGLLAHGVEGALNLVLAREKVLP